MKKENLEEKMDTELDIMKSVEEEFNKTKSSLKVLEIENLFKKENRAFAEKVYKKLLLGLANKSITAEEEYNLRRIMSGQAPLLYEKAFGNSKYRELLDKTTNDSTYTSGEQKLQIKKLQSEAEQANKKNKELDDKLKEQESLIKGLAEQLKTIQKQSEDRSSKPTKG